MHILGGLLIVLLGTNNATSLDVQTAKQLLFTVPWVQYNGYITAYLLHLTTLFFKNLIFII